MVVDLTEAELRITVDTLGRRLEDIKAAYKNQPQPLVAILIRSTMHKLQRVK